MALSNSFSTKEIALVVSMAAGVAYSLRMTNDSKKRLPPGPKSHPFIGHMLSIPRSSEHVAYANMSKELNSDIVALSAMGQTIVVLNSVEATSELLDKRSSIYSGRAQIPAVCDEDMMDWGQGVSFLNNNDRWRRDRRMLHKTLHKGAVPRYYPAQEKQIRALVGRLLNTPSTLEAFNQELRFALGATLLHATYGYLPTSPDDLWITDATTATDHIAQAAQPTKFIVNFIPSLKFLPNWLPGMGWRQTIKEWREHKEKITAAPYNWTKEQIRNGTAAPSIVENLLSAFPNHAPHGDDDLHIKLMSATMFGGGLETTVATASFFLLAIVLYPEVAVKIQEEVDRVLGNAQRLPTVQDQEEMPYLRRVLLEVQRWQPVNPLAIPHAVMEDDEYRGYYIPKGSIVIGNTWAITRDESIYPQPECFNPDRYLDPKVPPAPVFGYGRRVCPGNHFADANLFLLTSSLLYLYDVKRAVDENGRDIIPEIKMMIDSTISRKPQSFPLFMKPRSEAHKKLAMEFIL
uniref:Cytochrome P450 n=1 Tax=Thanatephorus cucumeris TaxID=107832 RepID=A0A2R4RMN9_THACU|nr:cytochrome P450 [Thanatephorus cucumeris]QDJ74245.1 cytochrome P450-5 [Thanatephorus cucumeris]